MDFENNLNTTVARLREVLGDSAEHPRFIETLPKRGYRFIAAVAQNAEHGLLQRRSKVLVLPFENLSGDPREELTHFDQSIAALRTAVKLSRNSAALLGWLGLSLGSGGREAEARGVLAELQTRASNGYVPATALAWIYIGLGQIDSAFEWLDRAADDCDQFVTLIKSYPFFDAIRTDPRYLALLARMHLNVQNRSKQ